MFTIEIQRQNHAVASVPVDESVLRDLAYASGACTQTVGDSEAASPANGYTVRLHRNPGSDHLQVTIRAQGAEKAEMHVSTEGVRDLLDAEHTTWFLSCGYDEMAEGGPGHGYAVAFTRPTPWLSG